MKRLLILILLCAPLSHGAVPTLVRATYATSNNGVSACHTNASGASCAFNLAEPTLSGNILVVFVRWNTGGGSPTMAISDNKSSTYSVAGTAITSAGNNEVEIFYTANTVSGIATITPTTSAAETGVQVAALEYMNVATSSPVDVAGGCGATYSSTTTAACNSKTPATTGDLLAEFCLSDGSGISQTFTAGSQANITWALAQTEDLSDTQWAIQSGQYNSTAAIAMSMTLGTSNSGVCIGGFFKSAAAGTAESAGIHIDNEEFEGFASNNYTSPLTVQLPAPATDNFMFIHWIGSSGTVPASVTDTNSNTWTCVADYTGDGGGDLNYCYAVNATCSPTEQITITLNASGVSNNSFDMYAMSGVASVPFDSAATCSAGTAPRCETTGNQTVSGNVTGVSITPSTANGIAFYEIGVNSNTIISTTVGTLDGLPFQCSSGGGTGCANENNGWGHITYSSISAISPVWGTFGGAVSFWNTQAVAIKASNNGVNPRGFLGGKSFVGGKAIF